MDRLTVDLLVVGGGIHGAGIARDAAGRGLSVLLAEQGDLAGATSSASSKLAHGGLRYLELGDFRLVREALQERGTLMRIAPHLVRPIPFFIPCGPGTRPRWQLRAGLALYDWLSPRGGLPRSCALDLSGSAEGALLQPQYRRGFCYYDGCADDARLVVANAIDAAARGAIILTHTRCARAVPGNDGWLAELVMPDGMTNSVAARAIVNATGPWVVRFLRECTPVRTGARARLIQGSHLVVRSRPLGGRALLLQNDDGRVVFVIPFESEHALIGTTDVPFAGDPGQVAISEAEVDYLCRSASRYLADPVARKDVIWTFAGVRALYDDGNHDPSRLTRDYALQLDHAGNRAPVLSIFGGKLTTYRRLAEEALAKLGASLPSVGSPWTAEVALPGGNLDGLDVGSYAEKLSARYPGLPAGWIAGIARRHGALTELIIGSARGPEDLGVHFGAGLTAHEVGYLYRQEWVRDPDDILWRRTKAGLHLTEAQRDVLARHLHELASDAASPRLA